MNSQKFENGKLTYKTDYVWEPGNYHRKTETIVISVGDVLEYEYGCTDDIHTVCVESITRFPDSEEIYSLYASHMYGGPIYSYGTHKYEFGALHYSFENKKMKLIKKEDYEIPQISKEEYKPLKCPLCDNDLHMYGACWDRYYNCDKHGQFLHPRDGEKPYPAMCNYLKYIGGGKCGHKKGTQFPYKK